MTKPKFTPGPWHADVRTGCLAVYPKSELGEWGCLSGASREAIHYSDKGAKYENHLTGGYWTMDEEAQANACLIAVAPEMYYEIEKAEDMLRRIGVDTQDPDDCNEIMHMAGALRKLLAKARGES